MNSMSVNITKFEIKMVPKNIGNGHKQINEVETKVLDYKYVRRCFQISHSVVKPRRSVRPPTGKITVKPRTV